MIKSDVPLEAEEKDSALEKLRELVRDWGVIQDQHAHRGLPRRHDPFGRRGDPQSRGPLPIESPPFAASQSNNCLGHEPAPNAPSMTRAEAVRVARIDGFGSAAIVRILAQEAPRPDRSILEWLLLIRDIDTELRQPRGAKSSALVSAPVQSAAAELPVATSGDDRRLTLLEYASLSMGLEVLPTDQTKVYEAFGLATPEAQERETAAWALHFEAHPDERKAFVERRLKFRSRWLPTPDPVPEAPRAVAPVAIPSEPSNPPARRMTLDAYARCSAEMKRRPGEEQAVLAYFGVDSHSEWLASESYWRSRMSENPELAAEVDRLAAAHEQLLQRAAVSSPVAGTYVKAVANRTSDVSVMGIEEYAVYVVELERAKDRDAVHRRHGVRDPAQQVALEAHYKSLFERDARSYAKWASLVAETRDGWMDF